MDLFNVISNTEEFKKLMTYVKVDKSTDEFVEFGNVCDGFKRRYYRLRANGKVQVQSINATSWTTWKGSSIPSSKDPQEIAKCLKANLAYLLDKVEFDVEYGKKMG